MRVENSSRSTDVGSGKFCQMSRTGSLNNERRWRIIYYIPPPLFPHRAAGRLSESVLVENYFFPSLHLKDQAGNLADEAFDGNQSFRHRVDGQKQTLQSNGPKQWRTAGRDEAWGSNLLSVQG